MYEKEHKNLAHCTVFVDQTTQKTDTVRLIWLEMSLK